VDAPLAFRYRDPLNPMHAPFILEPAEGALTVDSGNDLLEPANASGVSIQNLHPPPAQLGIAGIHPEKVGHKKRCFVTAGTGPDLEDDIFLIHGIFGRQHELEPHLGGVEFIAQAGEVLSDELDHFRIGFGFEHLLVLQDLLSQLAILAIGLNHRRHFCVFPSNLLIFLLISQYSRLAELLLQLQVFFFYTFQAVKHSSSGPPSIPRGCQ